MDPTHRQPSPRRDLRFYALTGCCGLRPSGSLFASSCVYIFVLYSSSSLLLLSLFTLCALALLCSACLLCSDPTCSLASGRLAPSRLDCPAASAPPGIGYRSRRSSASFVGSGFAAALGLYFALSSASEGRREKIGRDGRRRQELNALLPRGEKGQQRVPRTKKGESWRRTGLLVGRSLSLETASSSTIALSEVQICGYRLIYLSKRLSSKELAGSTRKKKVIQETGIAALGEV